MRGLCLVFSEVTVTFGPLRINPVRLEALERLICEEVAVLRQRFVEKFCTLNYDTLGYIHVADALVGFSHRPDSQWSTLQ